MLPPDLSLARHSCSLPRNSQAFHKMIVSTDTIYKGLITGCALTGPSGCAIASEGDGPLDIDAKVQKLLNTAYNATKLNASVPITSGDIRREWCAKISLRCIVLTLRLQSSCSARCIVLRTGLTS